MIPPKFNSNSASRKTWSGSNSASTAPRKTLPGNEAPSTVPRKTLPANHESTPQVLRAGIPSNVPAEYLEQNELTRKFCDLFDPDKDLLTANTSRQHSDVPRGQLHPNEALSLAHEAYDRRYEHSTGKPNYWNKAEIPKNIFTKALEGQNISYDTAEKANEIRPLFVTDQIARGKLDERAWPTVVSTLEMLVPYDKLRQDSFVEDMAGVRLKNPELDHTVEGSPAHQLSKILGTTTIKGDSGKNFSKEIPIQNKSLREMLAGKATVKRNTALKINLGKGLTGSNRQQSSIEHWHLNNMVLLANKRPPRPYYDKPPAPSLEELKRKRHKHSDITSELMQNIFTGLRLPDTKANRLQFAKDFGIPRRYIDNVLESSRLNDKEKFVIPLGDRWAIMDKMDKNEFLVAKRPAGPADRR